MSSQLKKQKKILKKRVNNIVKSLPKKINKIRGRGGYFDDAVNWGKKAWSNLNEDERSGASAFNKVANKVGQAIGSEFGIGKQLGNAGSWLSRVFGMGKYTIKSNSLLHPSGENVVRGMDTLAPPSFSSTGKGSDIIFSHREYVADVLSSVAFRTTTYPINPGNPSLFPWMNQIASLYEEYEMLGMILEYKSSSGSSNTAAVPGMGLVLMATDYDPYDSTFNSKRQMEAAEFSCSGVPYSNFLHPIECDPKRNVLRTQYVVPGITNYTQASGDARLSVLGNTTIATIGQQADDVTMGELWVTYHVRLSRPILETKIQTFSQHFKTELANTGFITQSVDFVTAGQLPFSVSTTGSGTTLRLLINNFTNQLTGNFRITYTFVAGTAGALNVPSVVASIPEGIQNLGLTNTIKNDIRGDTFGFPLSQQSNSGVSSSVFNISLNSVISIPLMSYDVISMFDLFIDRVDSGVANPQIYSRNENKAFLTKQIFKDDSSKNKDTCNIVEEKFKKQVDSKTVASSCLVSPSSILKNRLIFGENKCSSVVEKISLAASGGWTMCEEKEFLQSFVNQLEKDNVDNYTLDICNDKLDIIKELITTEIPDSSLSFLLAKMKLICVRLRQIQD